MPACQTAGAKSSSARPITSATSSTGVRTFRAAKVAAWSTCMMPMWGPFCVETAAGTAV
jgi:hypothetical protein